jgi:hypothetical protein
MELFYKSETEFNSWLEKNIHEEKKFFEKKINVTHWYPLITSV